MMAKRLGKQMKQGINTTAKWGLMVFLLVLTTMCQEEKPPLEGLPLEWETYKSFLKNNFPGYHGYLNPPASEQEVSAFQQSIAVSLPEEFYQLYRRNNGQSSKNTPDGIFLGLNLLPLAEVIQERKDLIALTTSYDLSDNYPTYPAGAVRPSYYDTGWIPLFSDTNGNYLMVDMNPGANGTKGQIINVGTDEADHCVLAHSITDLLHHINVKIVEEEIARKSKEGNWDEIPTSLYGYEGHLIDDLREDFFKENE